MPRITQAERILEKLRDVGTGLFNASGFVIVRDGHRWLSARYFKHEMKISECNGRISELRNDGHDILTLEGEKDEFGFAYHRLASSPKRKKMVGVEYEMRDGVRTAVPKYQFI